MNEHRNQTPAEAGRRTELRSRIRPLGHETPDEVFLPFLELCFNWSMDKPRVEVDGLLERDDAAFYFRDWGRNGDIAVAAYAGAPTAGGSGAGAPTAGASNAGEVAEADSTPEIIGLAWLRLAAIEAVVERSTRDSAAGEVPAGESTDADPTVTTEAGSRFTGYGWVAADIPELTIAVLPDHQSQGIGGMLLDVVCTLAKMSGFPAVSLSVEDGNEAARLYHDHGFVTVGRNGDSDILVRRLK